MTTNAVTRRGVRIDRNIFRKTTPFFVESIFVGTTLSPRAKYFRKTKKVTHALALALDRGSLRCYSGSLALDFFPDSRHRGWEGRVLSTFETFANKSSPPRKKKH